MTPEQIEMALALRHVTFVPATSTKRFAKNMIYHAQNMADKELSEKQAQYLYAVVHRFRRQIKASTVEKAQALIHNQTRESGV